MAVGRQPPARGPYLCCSAVALGALATFPLHHGKVGFGVIRYGGDPAASPAMSAVTAKADQVPHRSEPTLSATTGNRSAVRNRPRWDYRDFLAAMNAALSAGFQCVGQPGLLVDLEQRPGLHGAGPVQALGEPGMDWGE